MSSYTVYTLQTTSQLPSYDHNKLYKVDRRFSDFEYLYNKLQEMVNYRGLIIPNLPPKQYLGSLSNDFLNQRKDGLNTFLRILTTHSTLKYDLELRAFLTVEDYKLYRTDPMATEKVRELYNQLPRLRDLSIASLTTSLQN